MATGSKNLAECDGVLATPLGGPPLTTGREVRHSLQEPVAKGPTSPVPPSRPGVLKARVPEFCPGAVGHVTETAMLEEAFIEHACRTLSFDAWTYMGDFFDKDAFFPGLLKPEAMAPFVPAIRAIWDYLTHTGLAKHALRVHFLFERDGATGRVICVPRWA